MAPLFARRRAPDTMQIALAPSRDARVSSRTSAAENT
jgi:hypothetical protein